MWRRFSHIAPGCVPRVWWSFDRACRRCYFLRMAKSVKYCVVDPSHQIPAYGFVIECPVCGGEVVEGDRKERDAAIKKMRSPASEGVSVGVKTGAVKPPKPARPLSSVSSSRPERIPTGIEEFDRVIGGGFIKGMTCLLGAPPGTGKSSLLAHVSKAMCKYGTVLYVSGEESEEQVYDRAARLNSVDDNILIAHENDLSVILGHLESVRPSFFVLDSLQMVASPESQSQMGSVAQSREATIALNNVCKDLGITAVFINQFTKSGELAGSEQAKHATDCVLVLSSDKSTPLKFLSADKNRFGDTGEVGIFRHTEHSFEGVSDPSGVFMEDDGGALPGTGVSFMAAGKRMIPVEVQALMVNTEQGRPVRSFNGIPFGRGQVACAVLDSFCDAKLSKRDVFLSTIAGIQLPQSETLCDLGTAAAMLSFLHRKSDGKRRAYIGELALSGRIHGVHMIERRVREALRLGFDEVVVPAVAARSLPDPLRDDKRVRAIGSVSELAALFR